MTSWSPSRCSATGSLLNATHSTFCLRLKWELSKGKMGTSVRLQTAALIEEVGGWYSPATVTEAFFILSTCLVYIILGFDVPLMPHHEKLDKYQGNRISLLAQLYYASTSLLQRGCRSQPCALKNPPAWPEMK